MNKLFLVSLIALTQLLLPIVSASPLFDKSNANMWLVDDKGRISGYVYQDGSYWTDSFILNADGQTIYPLQNNEQALVNNLAGSSQMLAPELAATSIVGLSFAELNTATHSGSSTMSVYPEGGNFTETVKVEISVNSDLLTDSSLAINALVVGQNTVDFRVTKALDASTEQVDGQLKTSFFLVRNDTYNVQIQLVSSAGIVAEKNFVYVLANTDAKGDRRDTDADGIPDLVELELGLDPLSNDWDKDSDGNGWSDLDQWLRQGFLDANGVPIDSDNDGWSDFDENLRNTNEFDAVASLETTADSQAPEVGTDLYNKTLQLFRDVPAARRLYEVEYLVDAKISDFELDVKWRSYSSYSPGEGIIYDSKELLSASQLSWAGADAEQIPFRRKQLQLDELRTEQYLLGLRLPASDGQILDIQGVRIEKLSAAEIDDGQIAQRRNWHRTHWLNAIADLTVMNFDGGEDWDSAEQWKDAYIEFLEDNIVQNPALTEEILQINQASSTDVAMLLAVLIKEYQLSGIADIPIFEQIEGMTSQVVNALKLSMNSTEGGRDFNALMTDLQFMARAGNPLQASRDAIESYLATMPWGSDSYYYLFDYLQAEQADENSLISEFMYLSRLALYRDGLSSLLDSGIANLANKDLNSDNDNLINKDEILLSPHSKTTYPWSDDTDGDGVSDHLDSCPLDSANRCVTGVPNLTLSSDFSITATVEGGFIVVTVQINEAYDKDISVDFELMNGTAIAGEDYIDMSGTILIPAGDLTATLLIQIPPAVGGAAQEVFYLVLSNAVNVTLDQNIYNLTINNSLNAAPIAYGQSVSVTANVATSITLDAEDANDDSLSYNIVVMPLYGSLTGVAPNLIYTPYDDFSGLDSFTFVASDGQLSSEVARVDITVSELSLNTTELVSVDSFGYQGYGKSSDPVVSGNGRFVAFTSKASLHPDDNNYDPFNLAARWGSDIYVRDLSTGVTELISFKNMDDPLINAVGGEEASISFNGRYVAFKTNGAFDPNDQNNLSDIYVYDRTLSNFTLVSKAFDTSSGSNGLNVTPKISSNGRFVTYASSATNLIGENLIRIVNRYNVFVYDMHLGRTKLISLSSDGTSYGNDHDSTGGVSNNGDVTFTTRSTNLISSDINSAEDILVVDQITPISDNPDQWDNTPLEWTTPELVSVNSLGVQGSKWPANATFGARNPSISADGNLIVFSSWSTNLIVDGNGDLVTDVNSYNPDVFIRDRAAGTTELVTVSSSGSQGTNSNGGFSSMSSNGRFITFGYHGGSLLDPISYRNAYEVYVHDRLNKTTEIVSLDSSGNYRTQLSFNQPSWVPPARLPSVSDDGAVIAFETDAEDLIVGSVDSNPEVDWNADPSSYDNQDGYDIFIRKRDLGGIKGGSWEGDQISSVVITPDFPGQLDWPVNSSTISFSEVEFSSVVSNTTTTADFTQDTLTIIYENTSTGCFNCTYPALTIEFSDLDYPGGITSLTELSSNFNLSISTEFTQNTMTLHIGQQNTNPGDKFIAVFEF